MLEVTLKNISETENLAKKIASLVKIGDLITLDGDLGTGKTSFARFFIRSLTNNKEEIPSPTFTLMQSYDTPNFPIHHIDLYRINSTAEVIELGIEESFDNGVSLIEWPKLAEPIFPSSYLAIELSFLENDIRLAKINSFGNWIDRIKAL